MSAHEGTAVPRSIPKPRPVKSAKTGALLTLRMGDLLASLTDRDTSTAEEDGSVEGRNNSPAPKRIQGKKAVIEPSERTTRSKSTQKALHSTPRETRARGRN